MQIFLFRLYIIYIYIYIYENNKVITTKYIYKKRRYDLTMGKRLREYTMQINYASACSTVRNALRKNTMHIQ